MAGITLDTHDRISQVASEFDISPLKSTEFGVAFMRLIEASIAPFDGYEDFRHFIRKYVRPLLPHGNLLIVIGRTTLGKVIMDHIVTVDFPAAFADQINKHSSLAERPVISHWLTTQKPVLIDRNRNFHLLSDLERWENETFKLGALAIHGHLDMSGRMASYYCFTQVKGLSDNYGTVLEIIIPHLQVALMKALTAEYTQNTDQMLTPKEHEILHWIVAGRTNREIAVILKKSEMTVRNQVHCVLKKLNASNRAEAAQRADELGLLVQWPSVRVGQSPHPDKQQRY